MSLCCQMFLPVFFPIIFFLRTCKTLVFILFLIRIFALDEFKYNYPFRSALQRCILRMISCNVQFQEKVSIDIFQETSPTVLPQMSKNQCKAKCKGYWGKSKGTVFFNGQQSRQLGDYIIDTSILKMCPYVIVFNHIAYDIVSIRLHDHDHHLLYIIELQSKPHTKLNRLPLSSYRYNRIHCHVSNY